MITRVLLTMLWGMFCFSLPAQEPVYDIVILNGRVINPESQLDSIGLSIGIAGDSIAILTSKKIAGRKVIDANGLIVTPGFIDILSYNPNVRGAWNKIADGVTTNLAMHGGTAYPESWYARFEKERPPLNFGASYFYTEARNTFGLGRYESAQPHQIEKLLKMAEEGLKRGCLGISFSLEYVPGISPAEIRPMMKLAARYDVPVFFHLRYSDMEEPGTNIDALNEVIGYARESGAAIHIAHINSTGGTFSMEESLALIGNARAEGLDITACVYPYSFWGTYLNSARFDRGWQKRFRISYEDLQIAGTMERLTKESFERYRKEGKLAVAYAIPEEDVVTALRSPFVMIGSDAILTSGNNHPRASGAFSRTIARYVREKQTISLMDAIAKMTLLPAQRLEKSSADFKRKGRLSVGADADVVVFSFEGIRDRATVEEPHLTSEGILFVLVGGMIVKDPSGLKKNVRPGKAIRRGD